MSKELTLEKKQEKLKIYWAKTLSKSIEIQCMTSDLVSIMSEIVNPKIPLEILRIWISLIADSIANFSLPNSIRTEIINIFIKNPIFGQSNTPQNNCLDLITHLWQNLLRFNRLYLPVVVQFIFRNILSNENESCDLFQNFKNFEDIEYNFLRVQYPNYESFEEFFNEKVMSSLRTSLSMLPVDLQYFEIKVP